MDINCSFSNEEHSSKPSLPLKSPSSDQEYPHQHVRSCHEGCGSTLAERRSFMAASQLVLSRKRSIRNLVSEHSQNVQASDPRSLSPSRLSKLAKEPRIPVSPHPQYTRDHGRPKDASRPVLKSFGPNKACAAEQEAFFNCQSKSASLRTLASPIKFKGSLESFATYPYPGFMDRSAPRDQSKYRYYPPTNPLDGPQRFSSLHNSGPYRRLSYGGPAAFLDSQICHKTTASRDQRRKASFHVKDDNCLSLYYQNPEAIQAKPWDSEPSQLKTKLWLDLAEDEETEKLVSLQSLPNQRTCS